MTKHKRIFLEHDKFRLMRLFLQSREIYFIAGTNSLTVPSRQEKYIMFNRPDGSHICRYWIDENGEQYLMTPGEAARAELARAFPGLRRVGWQASTLSLLDWRWPMLFTGPYEGKAVYIDLKGAYHQIYSRLWLDVAFPAGYGTLSLASVADRLAEWKPARNSIVGITASREIHGVKGTRTYVLHAKNPYLSPHLWATVQSILNEIAFKAESLGAIYIATDGYIFPEEARYWEFEEFLIDFGLKYRVLRGKSEIKNWGCYRVGPKKTQTFDKQLPGIFQPLRSINIVDTRQPLKMVGWWGLSVPNYTHHKWKAEGYNNVAK